MLVLKWSLKHLGCVWPSFNVAESYIIYLDSWKHEWLIYIGSWLWKQAKKECFPMQQYSVWHWYTGPNCHFGWYIRYWSGVTCSIKPNFSLSLMVGCCYDRVSLWVGRRLITPVADAPDAVEQCFQMFSHCDHIFSNAHSPKYLGSTCAVFGNVVLCFSDILFSAV